MNSVYININLYDLGFLAVIITAIIFAVQLFFTPRKNQAANKFLSLALMVLGLTITAILTSDIFKTQVWPIEFPLTLGPLLYFYVLKITRPASTFGYKALLHFVPFTAALFFYQYPPLLHIMTFFSVGCYLYGCNRLIENFYQALKFNELNDRYRSQLRWLKQLLKTFGILWSLWLPFMISSVIGFNLPASLYYPIYLLQSIFLIRIAVTCFLKEDIPVPLSRAIPARPVVPPELRQKGDWLVQKMQENLYYRDEALTLRKLAESLALTPNELSRIINSTQHKSFNDFINEYRVREVIRKIQEGAGERLTLIGLALDAGFNSKASFNRVFKEMTGKTPAEVKLGLKNDSSNYILRPRSRSAGIISVRQTTTRWAELKLNRKLMFRNYVKMAWRNSLRNISYSSINIIGLGAGLCSFIVILLYMNYELSYDRWSPEMNKVYRVSLRMNEDYLNNTPAPLAGFLAQKYQNADAATMLQSSGDRQGLLTAGERKIYQKNLVTVDSNFLKVFPYKLASGNAATALNEPKTAIVTRELGRKLFGSENPMGRSIKLNDRADLMVTGVLEDQQGATHLPIGMLIHDAWGRLDLSWDNLSCQTYIKLRRAENDTSIEKAINRPYYDDHIKDNGVSFEDYTKAGAKTNLFVDQVPRMHNFPKHGSSNFSTVTILLVLAILLLLAGAINFSNLAIAQSISRAKEVGIRKVMGAGRMPLILQFMSETALQCLASLILAAILLALAVPYINRSFNINISFLQPHEILRVVLQLIGCLLGIILLSGLYPAFYLSKFNAVKVLKGNYSTGSKGTLFRNSLIVVQFMISVLFITGIIVIKSQMSYMQMKDKGFSADQLMRLEARQETREQGFENTRNMLLSVPGVVSVAKTTSAPGDNFGVDTSTIPFKNNGKDYRMRSVKVSTDYFKTLGVSLKKGRLFTNDVQDQQTRSAVINEAAAQKLALPDPVGDVLYFPGCDSTPVRIVGVVKDFNVRGFENAIQPEVFTVGNHQPCLMQFGSTMLVKLDSRHAQQTIAGITQAWKKIEPAFPLRYSFVDQNFEQLLISYVRLEKIITFFGLVATMISVMGLFALTAFFTRQRTKEIGVRKVLGASVPQLATLLSRDFIFVVLVSVVIVTPFSWWMARKWLQSFAYRIDTGWWMFFAAGAVAVLIAIITVSFQTVKAALANPADSLRSE